MPKTQEFKAKKTLRLDCGHTVNAGEPFLTTTVYTCRQEALWPLKILLACFQVIREKHHGTQAKLRST